MNEPKWKLDYKVSVELNSIGDTDSEQWQQDLACIGQIISNAVKDSFTDKEADGSFKKWIVTIQKLRTVE